MRTIIECVPNVSEGRDRGGHLPAKRHVTLMLKRSRGFPSLLALSWALATLLGVGYISEARAEQVLALSSDVGASIDFNGSGTSATFVFKNNLSGSGFHITSSSGVGARPKNCDAVVWCVYPLPRVRDRVSRTGCQRLA